MKIASDHASHQGQTASDVRRRLSTEATYDRTMEQMESAMWPGGKAGPQAVAPAPRVRAYVETALIRTPPMASEARIEASWVQRPDHDGASVIPGGFLSAPVAVHAEDAPASQDAARDDAPVRNAVHIAMPAGVPSDSRSFDAVATTRVRSTPRAWRDVEGQVPDNIVWSSGEHGVEITIRDVVRSGPTPRFASEALAQIRRHGLWVRRLTINGATAGAPATKGETP